MQKDDAAHAEEQGIMLLPFLHRKNPEIQITPIALADAGIDDVRSFAAALAEWVADLQQKGEPHPLIIVSTDMTASCR